MPAVSSSGVFRLWPQQMLLGETMASSEDVGFVIPLGDEVVLVNPFLKKEKRTCFYFFLNVSDY